MRKLARKNMAGVGVLFTAILLLAVAGLSWSFFDRHSFFCPIIQKNRCVRNLHKIEQAKEEYRAERSLTNGAPVMAEQLVDYLDGGWKCLRCPGSGTYTIQPLGEPPACSEPDHR